ncbi:MAG: metallophosphoesterase [Verrucomicrobia bacterium]|nr:metallophosphoesterase [Verrucomicrobiota bacterium]
MKILHVADLHFHQPSMDWVSAQSCHYDVTVIAGDLLNQFAPNMGAQIPAVRAWLRTFPGPLVVCSGNHDFFPSGPNTRAYGSGRWLRTLMGKPNQPEAAEQPFAEVVAREGVWADGARFSLGGLRWEVCGWAQVKPDTGQGADVLVVHAPPSNRGVAMQGDRDLGDSVLLSAITKHAPRFVLSGHVHNPRSWSAYVGNSLCLNTGCDLSGMAPAHIVIDTDANTVVWRAPKIGKIETMNLKLTY